MNQFKKILSLHNISLVNPIWDSISKKEVVGWMFTSPSTIRKSHSIELVQKIINEYNLDHWIEEIEFTNQFMVYKNKSDN